MHVAKRQRCSQSNPSNISLKWTVSLITITFILMGCQSNGLFGLSSTENSTPRQSGVFDFEPNQTTTEANISPQAISLAEQSKRDIASFLAQSSPTKPEATSLKTPPRVLFNEPTKKDQIPVTAITETSPLAAMPKQGIANQTEEKTITRPPEALADIQPNATAEPLPIKIKDLDAHMQRIMIEFSRELYHQSTRSDMPVRELMLLAAMTMVDPTRQISPDAMPDLTESEQALLKTMQEHFIELGQSLDGSQDATRAVRTTMANLQQALSEQPDLTIKTAVLCTRVRGFGDYDELNLSQLVAHRSQQAVLYIEINEFASELNENNEWVTVTSQQLTIYSERDGIPVWQEDWRTAIDRSRQQRNDFFTVQLLSLPEPLSVGKYQLKIRIRDDKSGAETERSIPFMLLAQPGGLRGVGD
jgi:hypothetical protein